MTGQKTMTATAERLRRAWAVPQKRPELLTAAYICIMLGIFPLIAGIHGYRDITAAKYTAFLVFTCAYLMALAAALLRRRRCCGSMGITIDWPQRLILVYAGITLLSAIFSSYPQTVWLGSGRFEGWLTLAAYLAVFLAVSCCGRFRPLYIYVFAAAVLVNDIIAVLQFMGLNPLWLYPHGYDYYGGNVAYNGEFLGTIGNSGMLAAFLCLAIPAFVCYFIRRCREDRYAWAVLAVALLSVGVLLRSAVLAGVVGLAAVCVVLPFLLLPSRKKCLLWLVIVILLLLFLLLFLWFYQGESGPLYEASALLHGNADDSFGSGRVRIWRESAALIPEAPWLGGGPDTLKDRLQLTFVSDDRQTIVDTAHCDYLNIAVNTGLPSLAVYLAALLFSAALWGKRRRNGAVLICGAAVFCYCVQVAFSFSICITAPLFWLFWGLFCAAARK
ncbi:MAG: O-antigen ligase family protein [Firmicutes bacterium]|nr:O-antigen ligase family protein [Bacillota bacterium]